MSPLKRGLNVKCWFDQKTQYIIKHKTSLSHINIRKEFLIFGNTEIEKKKRFYFHKTPTLWEDVDIEKY